MRGRKKTKEGQRISLYLSNEEVAILNKLTYDSKSNKSKYMGLLLRMQYEKFKTNLVLRNNERDVT